MCIGVCNPAMPSDEIINLLKADGWKRAQQKGSHVQFKHARKLGKVTVPHSRKDLAPGTAKAILKKAGI